MAAAQAAKGINRRNILDLHRGNAAPRPGLSEKTQGYNVPFMSKRAGLTLWIATALLFLLMNRGAYRGYFTDDELDNISWTQYVPVSDFLKDAASPLFLKFNFRPVGHFYFYAMESACGLDFPKYVAVLHGLHLLNVWLLWLLLRRLGAPPPGAVIGVAFFAFHMALFDALWKPMYVFDVLCGTWSLACLLLWIDRRWLLSFVCFWLAYRSKELAVMLPAALACYEWLLGEKRWKPLLPFFAASLSFGLQGVLLNPNKDNDYTFRFTPAAVVKTSVFYAGRLLLLPFAGFALLAAPWLARNRRAWFGLAMTGLVFAPLLFLPGRLFSAYCYAPLLGVAVMLSGFDFTDRRVQAATVAFALLWLPWNFQQMRLQRRAKLAKDDEVRVWVKGLQELEKKAPETESFVFAGAPGGLQRWGVEGAIRYVFARPKAEIRWIEDKEAWVVMQRRNFALLAWDGVTLQTANRSPSEPDAPYVPMNMATPVWQLGEGWYGLEGAYRWIQPEADARLFRPAGARRFVLRVNIGQEQLDRVGRARVTLRLNGAALDPAEFSEAGWRTHAWDLPPAAPSTVKVTFTVEPGFTPGNETRRLGLAIGGFGFETTP
jgi:hypothetical protein